MGMGKHDELPVHLAVSLSAVDGAVKVMATRFIRNKRYDFCFSGFEPPVDAIA